METEARKIRVVETEERGKKERSRKETERKRGKTKEGKEKTKERKKNRSKESSRRMGDLGWEGESSKVRGKDEEVGSSKIP